MAQQMAIFGGWVGRLQVPDISLGSKEDASRRPIPKQIREAILYALLANWGSFPDGSPAIIAHEASDYGTDNRCGSVRIVYQVAVGVYTRISAQISS